MTTITFRLKGIMRYHERDRLLSQLTPRLAAELFAERCKKSAGDTQVGELTAVRGFAEWCMTRGWLAADPFAGLVPMKGRSRKRRKQQHRIDEARTYRDIALAGGEAGLAAAMALLMDLRASEIIQRTVRDVDDGGTVLVIEDAKTEAGERRLEIPQELRGPIAHAAPAGGRAIYCSPAGRGTWVGYHVRRLCRLAGVPVISPHGLRRTHSSISAREVSIEHVAAALGHASPAVTRRHYVAPGVEQNRRTHNVAQRLGVN